MKRFVAALVACALFSACGGGSLQANPERGLTIAIDGANTRVENDVLQLGQRLVFSTAQSKERGPQSVVLWNRGTSSVAVSNISIDRRAFELSENTEESFEVPAGQSRVVAVSFVPLKVGLDVATLTFAVDGRPVSVQLSGLNAKGIEGSLEPDLQMIFDALGYQANVDMPPEPPVDIDVSDYDRANSISRSPRAIGDEVLLAYFERADASQPVRMLPLANYINRSGDELGWFGVHARDDFARTQNVLAFEGDDDELGGQNQQLLPGIGDGNYNELVSGSSIAFVPQFEQFGVWDGERNVSSDDRLNDASDHGMRIYPARTSNGPIANAYLVADDSGLPDFKNYDYQDVVFLLTNVRPVN